MIDSLAVKGFGAEIENAISGVLTRTVRLLGASSGYSRLSYSFKG
jgi:hypothetical protein